MDNVFFFTILMIFIAAFVGTIVRYRNRDKCLKGFADYFVRVVFKDKKTVWGSLRVFYNSLELIYTAPYLDPDGSHYETSFIVYQDQYPNLLMIKRFHDELTPAHQRRRQREIEITYHPNVWRRAWRRACNVLNLTRDAFTQAFGTLLGQMKKTTGSAFLTSQEGRLQQTAQGILATSNASYEPILEKYIGRRIVLEISQDGQTVEYCGVLKDYTNAFLCILDVPIEEAQEFNLANPQQLEVNRLLDFELSPNPRERAEDGKLKIDLAIKVTNKGGSPVHITHAEGQDYSQVIGRDIAPGTSERLVLEGIPFHGVKPEPPSDTSAMFTAPETPAQFLNVLPQVRLWIRASRYMDIIVPRPLGIVRHGAEHVD